MKGYALQMAPALKFPSPIPINAINIMQRSYGRTCHAWPWKATESVKTMCSFSNCMWHEHSEAGATACNENSPLFLQNLQASRYDKGCCLSTHAKGRDIYISNWWIQTEATHRAGLIDGAYSTYHTWTMTHTAKIVVNIKLCMHMMHGCNDAYIARRSKHNILILYNCNHHTRHVNLLTWISMKNWLHVGYHPE